MCAHTRFTTEDLLAHVLGGDVSEVFSWLRSLSFVEQGAFGLFPHDLARDVLDADLRWRDRVRYVELHRLIRSFVVGRAQHSRGADPAGLHRHPVPAPYEPAGDPYLNWSSLGQAFADVLRDGDRRPLLAMVERHEGDRSAAIAARWLDRRPEAFTVFRGAGGAPIGFTALLELHRATGEDLTADPGARAMWEYAISVAPPGSGEEVLAFRYFMDRDAYQAPSASFNVWSARGIQHIVTARNLAWSFVGAFADPDFVAPLFADIDYHRATGADFEVGGRRYGVFAHDFRRVTPEMWLELTGEREIAEDADPPTASVVAEALSHADFVEAVRQALRDLHAPERLATNPLLRARLVRARTGHWQPAEVLARVITETAVAVGGQPRDEKFYRALDRTYLRPAPTQERAAELLDLPFSTYRRHLTQGVERLTARLWHQEQQPVPDG